MKILIRADANEIIGTGHIIRCLCIAQYLVQKNAQVEFLCRPLPPGLEKRVQDAGFKIHTLPSDPALDAKACLQFLHSSSPQTIDWLIVDHYELDQRWERQLRPHVQKILAIDDLANRNHECDLLLDQNLYPHPRKRYQPRVDAECILLLGPEYAMLRPEFYQAKTKQNSNPIRQKPETLFIFYGGVDLTNETSKALQALKKLNHSWKKIIVVASTANPHISALQKILQDFPNAEFHQNTPNMAELIAQSDIALGAGGTNTWERCFLGLPTIVTQVADNQTESTLHLNSMGAIRDLGWYKDVTAEHIVQALQDWIQHPKKIESTSRESFKLFDHRAESHYPKIVDCLCHPPRLRPIQAEDLRLVLEWRNSDRIRSMMYTQHRITWEEHQAWFDRLGKDPTQSFQIFEWAGKPAGIVQWKKIDRIAHTAEWGFYIGDPTVPKGVGTLMGKLGLQFAFEKLQLKLFFGEALASNESSIRYHKRLGFEEIASTDPQIMRFEIRDSVYKEQQ